MTYARKTKVDASQSRLEVERLLEKQGCERLGVMTEQTHATIYFERRGWSVQMRIPMPRAEDAPKNVSSAPAIRAWVEARRRERWRQLLLVLKAKFCALEEGVETFEETFMAHLVVHGVHVGQRALPAIRDAQKHGAQLILTAGSNG